MNDRNRLGAGAEEIHGGLYLLLALAAAAFAIQIFVIPGSAQAARSRWASSREPTKTTPARQAHRFLTREAARHVITGGEAPASTLASAGVSMAKPSRFTWAGLHRAETPADEASRPLPRTPSRGDAAQLAAGPSITGEAWRAHALPPPARRNDATQAGSPVREEPATTHEWLASTPHVDPITESASLVAELPDDQESMLTPEESGDLAAVPDPDALSPDPEALLPAVSLQGEAFMERGGLVTILVTLDSAMAVAHAPLRLTWNPDVLTLEGAGEGQLFTSDGAATQFMAIRDPNPGSMDLVMSRIPPAGGIAGHGVLCAILFRAHSEGESPIVLTGSRLLDAKGRSLRFKKGETHVAVN